MSKSRSAEFEATLIYMDEPQLITLLSGKRKSRIVAIAIPSDNENEFKFLATTVSKPDWIKYLDSIVDLRYLFTVPTIRIAYYFNLADLKDGQVKMSRIDGEIPEEHLPLPRFFATNHTEEYEGLEKRASDPEQLIVDGEWELTDFGQFQQKFSDVYTFLVSEKNWIDVAANENTKKRIKQAFNNRPFQGGFSYVHLFKDLNDNVPRSDKISLNKIRYASPGKVEVFGKDEIFTTLERIIPNFVENRDNLKKEYGKFYKYLSKNKFLQMNGDHYVKGDASEKYIFSSTEILCQLMLAPNFNTVKSLSNENALVCAKVVLAFYRRLEESALYFSQGRVSYED